MNRTKYKITALIYLEYNFWNKVLTCPSVRAAVHWSVCFFLFCFVFF